jgi:CBS domain-containing protein
VVRAVAQGLDPNETRVSQAMTDQIECVFADEDLEVAMWKMREEQIRRILVVDHDNRLVGIISLGDIATAMGEQDAGETLEAISEPSQSLAH